MKLISLELWNFRQFYGKQEIDFAPGSADGPNITAFHGFNGAGKTALLNAFIWCLYGETTPDLEDPDRLVNERAFAETAIGNEVPCRVGLMFEFRGSVFRVERSSDHSRTGQAEFTKPRVAFQVTKTGPGGETESVGKDDATRQHRIEQILPRSLYPFFFFNGERVERLAAADAYDRVESGVKTLLDIEVYERGAKHLKVDVMKVLGAETRNLGDKQLADAMALLEEKSEEQERRLGEIGEHEGNIKALHDDIEALERRQENLRSVAALANRRKDLRGEEKELDASLKHVNRGLAALVSKTGYLAFGSRVLDATESQVAAARKRGDIPAKIKPQFVDDLLGTRECVCGRPIEENSPEEVRLLRWRESTGLAELEERIVHVSADIRTLRDRRQETFRQTDEALSQLNAISSKLRDCRSELAHINEKISEGDFGDEAAKIQDLIDQRRKEVIRHEAAKLRCRDRIAEIEVQISEINANLKKHKSEGDKAALAKRQMEAVQRVAGALAQIRDIQKEDVRLALDAQIRGIWQAAAIKDYEASVSSNYQLMLTKLVGGQRQPVTGASTGEKQVLALSFVGALVQKARENVGKDGGLETGGYFPLVMDSPFGSLEDDYRREVAEWLPTLANQIVVMASKTQWRNEVETAMRPRIGREYVLELHSPKKHSERSINIGGREFPYVVHDEDAAEMTLIKRVT